MKKTGLFGAPLVAVMLFVNVGSLKGQSGLPAHYYCVTSGVNNGLMHPSVARKTLFIYNQSEIAAMTAPVTGPVSISRIYFRTNNGGTANYTGVTIRMGHTSLSNATSSTTFATNFNVGAPVTVFSGSPSFVMSGSNSGCNVASTWFYVNLSTPFAYNFVNNLVVEVSYSTQSGVIPSFYALNPGGGANPTAITAATSGAATGSINARPMFGFDAGAVLGDEEIQLDLIESGDQFVTLELATPAGEYRDASAVIWNESGDSHTVGTPESGRHIVTHPFSGWLRASVSAIDVSGNLVQSNTVSWFNPTTVNMMPNPFSDQLQIQAGTAIRSVQVHNAMGQLVLDGAYDTNQLHLGKHWLPGIYFVRVTLTNGEAHVEKVLRW